MLTLTIPGEGGGQRGRQAAAAPPLPLPYSPRSQIRPLFICLLFTFAECSEYHLICHVYHDSLATFYRPRECSCSCGAVYLLALGPPRHSVPLLGKKTLRFLWQRAMAWISLPLLYSSTLQYVVHTSFTESIFNPLCRNVRTNLLI